MYRIRCHTLFNITKTGILNRRANNNSDVAQQLDWQKKRNSQCNFDTILQVISLRSQPEEISNTTPNKILFSKSNNFGFLFEQHEEECNSWVFDFSINHISVFADGITELGELYSDCDDVPMINGLGEWDKLPNFLDTSPELRNIYFEVLSHE